LVIADFGGGYLQHEVFDHHGFDLFPQGVFIFHGKIFHEQR
jgi:hypothetical protein